MGPLGMPELIVIFVIALLVFGPRKLPELGRSLGKSLGEFKRASNELRNTLEEEVRVEEQREATQRPAAAAPVDTPAGPRPVETPAVEARRVETRRRRTPSAIRRRAARPPTSARQARRISMALVPFPGTPSPYDGDPRRRRIVAAPTRCRSWSISTSSGNG